MKIAIKNHDSGFALLIVLWSLVLITLIVTQVTSVGRSAMQLSSNLRKGAILGAETDGVLNMAIFNLVNSTPGWNTDGSEHRIVIAGDLAIVRVYSEAGKVNLNNVSMEVLSALLRTIGEDQQHADDLAHNIIEWRLPSTEDAINGKKALLYREANRNYAPPNSSFQSIDELGLVLGVTPDLVTRIGPYVTLYSNITPDPRRADPVMAKALALARVSTPPRPLLPDHVVTIVVATTAADGARSSRKAIVSIGPDHAGRSFRIVTWNTF